MEGILMLLTFVVGMITGMVVLGVLVTIFDFDIKIEYVTGKSARIYHTR
jgi:hypothetical protein